DHRAVEALGAAMKDQSTEVRKKAAWALGLILMRDSKAADKAADLNIELKKDDDDSDIDDDRELDEDNVSGVRIPVGLDVPVPVPVPIPIVRVNVSPRVVVEPGRGLPSRTKSNQKDKPDGA